MKVFHVDMVHVLTEQGVTSSQHNSIVKLTAAASKEVMSFDPRTVR